MNDEVSRDTTGEAHGVNLGVDSRDGVCDAYLNDMHKL